MRPALRAGRWAEATVVRSNTADCAQGTPWHEDGDSRAAAVVPAFRQALGEDQRSKRLAQRLDNLERTNYTGALSTKHQSFQPALDGLGVVDHEPEEKLDQETLNSVLGSHASSKRRKKTTQTQAVRTLLTYRHTLEELISQSGLTTLSSSTPSYLTAVAPAPQTPPVQMCSVCGYWGKHACNRCGLRYCSVTCAGVHDESRCERR